MSIINCKVSTENTRIGYTVLRHTWTFFGIPVFSTVQVLA